MLARKPSDADSWTQATTVRRCSPCHTGPTVDHPFRGQPEPGYFCSLSDNPGGRQQAGPGRRPVDGAIHAAAQQAFIGRVHNPLHSERRCRPVSNPRHHNITAGLAAPSARDGAVADHAAAVFVLTTPFCSRNSIVTSACGNAARTSGADVGAGAGSARGPRRMWRICCGGTPRCLSRCARRATCAAARWLARARNADGTAPDARRVAPDARSMYSPARTDAASICGAHSNFAFLQEQSSAFPPRSHLRPRIPIVMGVLMA